MPVPNRIRELRRARGLSLRRLAADLGLDPTNLGRIETGRRGASDELKLRIAAHFGLPLTDVFFQHPTEAARA